MSTSADCVGNNGHSCGFPLAARNIQMGEQRLKHDAAKHDPSLLLSSRKGVKWRTNSASIAAKGACQTTGPTQHIRVHDTERGNA